jgi:hypothetical protein
VPITDELATKVLCLYFDTDHALIGSFEPDTFIHDLVSQKKGSYCTSLMVNALMFWACVGPVSFLGTNIREQILADI